MKLFTVPLLVLAAAILGVGGSQPPTPVHCKYVVKGLGFAGSEILKNIVESGESDFCVFEAKSTYGGRCRHVNVAGTKVATGCGWEAGVGHINSERLDECGIERKKQDFDKWHDYNRNGDEIDAPFDDYEVAVACADAIGQDLVAQDLDDITVEAALATCGWFPENEEYDLVENGCHEYEFAGPTVSSGLKINYPNYNYIDFQDNDFLITDDRGYEGVIECILSGHSGFGGVSDPRIYYSTPVVSTNMDLNEATLQNGTIVSYDYMFDTTPVGVIVHDVAHNEGAAYVPPVSGDALLGFTNWNTPDYARLFFHFPSKFWGNNPHFWNISPNVNNGCSIWHSLDAPGFNPGSKLLYLTCVSPTAEHLRGWTDDQYIETFMPDLRKVFGPGIPDPDVIEVFSWHHDEYARVAYVMATPALNLGHFDAMANWGPSNFFLQWRSRVSTSLCLHPWRCLLGPVCVVFAREHARCRLQSCEPLLDTAFEASLRRE